MALKPIVIIILHDPSQAVSARPSPSLIVSFKNSLEMIDKIIWHLPVVTSYRGVEDTYASADSPPIKTTTSDPPDVSPHLLSCASQGELPEQCVNQYGLRPCS
ncbi:hypothetical protein BDP27DRAFT_1452877 [Rhodocollybia butyracea]|uniref:Uncharacterized protein n=1 Tax=Rhodocollybia butyracea TaxID=206335 RepID=A0A9P5P767_9AGAR|nr:hypothetical protein BDP27DRAFT_1452877 [Rhodocollybia butyracea]